MNIANMTIIILENFFTNNRCNACNLVKVNFVKLDKLKCKQTGIYLREM